MQMAVRSHSSSLDDWNSRLREVCGPYKTEPTTKDESLFIGDIHACERAGLMLVHMKTNAESISREIKFGESVDDRYCFLVSQKRGRSTVTQGGEEIELSPGDIILMDSTSSCSIRPRGLMEHASLCLPRAGVREKLRKGETLFGLVSIRCTSGRVLHSMFDELCSDFDSGDSAENEQDAIVSAYASLIGPSLRAGRGEEIAIGALSGSSLRKHTERLIDESLASPKLSPAMLAGRLKISVRHLYRLFEDEGESVCRYIQKARLQKSASDLANPRFRQETITSIAYRWGFADSAHFSRSFKKEFSRSPREYRFEALGA